MKYRGKKENVVISSYDLVLILRFFHFQKEKKKKMKINASSPGVYLWKFASQMFKRLLGFHYFSLASLSLSFPFSSNTHTHTSLKVSSNFLLSTHFSLCHSNILFISTLTGGKTCSLLSFLLTVTWLLEVQHLLNHGFAPIIHALWSFFISLKFVDSKFSGVSVICLYASCFLMSPVFHSECLYLVKIISLATVLVTDKSAVKGAMSFKCKIDYFCSKQGFKYLPWIFFNTSWHFKTVLRIQKPDIFIFFLSFRKTKENSGCYCKIKNAS